MVCLFAWKVYNINSQVARNTKYVYPHLKIVIHTVAIVNPALVFHQDEDEIPA